MSEETRIRDTIELASGILLAAATVASAWCAYQSSLWSGKQIRSLSTASTAHYESLRKSARANFDTLVDVATFINYVEEESRGETKVAGFIRAHVRPEFKPALDAWIAEQRAGHPPTDLPFKSSRYHVAAASEADALQRQAAAAITAANQANANSDRFVLHTVMFALALFFLGTISNARRRHVRVATLAFGALVLTLATVSMARIPRAPRPPDRGSFETRAEP